MKNHLQITCSAKVVKYYNERIEKTQSENVMQVPLRIEVIGQE